MTDAIDPQSQRAPSQEGVGTPADVRTGVPQPSPGELNAALRDGSGDAVSAQPTDEHPADLLEARARCAWDEDTAEAAGREPD